MTDEQIDRLVGALDRIGDALDEISNLAMSRNTFLNMKEGHQPHLADCVAMIAEELAKKP